MKRKKGFQTSKPWNIMVNTRIRPSWPSNIFLSSINKHIYIYNYVCKYIYISTHIIWSTSVHIGGIHPIIELLANLCRSTSRSPAMDSGPHRRKRHSWDTRTVGPPQVESTRFHFKHWLAVKLMEAKFEVDWFQFVSRIWLGIAQNILKLGWFLRQVPALERSDRGQILAVWRPFGPPMQPARWSPPSN